jgi:hypothetical protein
MLLVSCWKIVTGLCVSIQLFRWPLTASDHNPKTIMSNPTVLFILVTSSLAQRNFPLHGKQKLYITEHFVKIVQTGHIFHFMTTFNSKHTRPLV